MNALHEQSVGKTSLSGVGLPQMSRSRVQLSL